MLKKVIGTIVLLVLVFGLISAITNNTIKDSKNVQEAANVNFKRPSFTLLGINSKKYFTDEVNKPLVINFWASWCGPCRSEAPELVKLYKEYHNKIQIFAVNLTSSDSESDAKAFAKEFGFSFPVLLDTYGEVANLYKISGIPTSYFVSKDGIIIDSMTGFGGKDELDSKFSNLAKSEN